MSKGNWSEWLGAHEANSSTPTYVALTDENNTNGTAIPALSNSNAYRYGAPPCYDNYPHYNPTTPSTAHYGAHQYNTPYYQHQYSANPLTPPADYYPTTLHKHKHKNKKKKKHKNCPPARPPKPTNVPTITPTVNIIQHSPSKQYELIVSNVPSQVRFRELHNALNAQKCHLTDFYIPDYEDPSTIIIVVKGFVQWRQLSKLKEIEIRGNQCPIKPKPLKSLDNNNGDADPQKEAQNEKKNEIETENEAQNKKEKQNETDDAKEVIKNDDDSKNKVEENREIDLISHLNELQGVFSSIDNGKTIANPKEITQDNVKNEIETDIKCDNEETQRDDNSVQCIDDIVIKEEQTALIPINMEPNQHDTDIEMQNNEDIPCTNEGSTDKGDTEDDDDDILVVDNECNVKLEVPDVPALLLSHEEDPFFVDDDDDDDDDEAIVTFNDLNDLMNAEQPKEEVNPITTTIEIAPCGANGAKKKDTNIRKKAHILRKKKLLPPTTKAALAPKKTKKKAPISAVKRSAVKNVHNVRKNAVKSKQKETMIKKRNAIKTSSVLQKNKLKLNSKMKRMRLNKNKVPMITVPRDAKCGITHEIRSMFMKKLVALSATFHDGMGLIQFQSMVIKIENMMKTHCKNTTTYKISCGQLLKQYRELKNIHKLELYAKEQYVAKNESAKAQTPIERLLLTKDQLEDNGYPLKTDYLEDEYKDFATVPSKKYGAKRYDLLAIDCEMCQTTEGNELTRISIVDSKLMVVYDKLVKPPNEIIDYLTQWSGITATLLQDVTRDIDQVHREIFEFIDADTILCGHSLENDLIAMKLIHYKVIDTAVLFMKRLRFRNNKRNIGYAIGSGGGRKVSLKQLCDEYLNKKIQSTKGPDGQIVGHSSVEDAIASMQLLQLQLKWEEDRNKKLGISVPDSVTKYAFYSNSNSLQKKEKMNKKKVGNDDDTEMLSAYGSNKRTKIDSSKHRFNPNLNRNPNNISPQLPVTSKEEMMSNLFEDDLNETDEEESDSEDVAILSPAAPTAKSMQATIIINGEAKTVEIDKNIGHSMLKLDCNGNISCVAMSGKKRKLNDDDDNVRNKKKMKFSPSKLKTKRKQIANVTEIACDSHSDSEINEDSDADSIHSIKSLSLSPSPSFFDTNDSYLSYSNKPPPPPPNEEEKHKKKKKKKKSSKHKKHKDRKKSKTKSKSKLEEEATTNTRYEEAATKDKKSKSKSKSKNLETKAKSIILEWCHKILNPLFKQKKITRKQYSLIAKKSVKKILESHAIWTPQSIQNLKTKSKHKVKDVIKAYVKKQTHSSH